MKILKRSTSNSQNESITSLSQNKTKKQSKFDPSRQFFSSKPSKQSKSSKENLFEKFCNTQLNMMKCVVEGKNFKLKFGDESASKHNRSIDIEPKDRSQTKVRRSNDNSNPNLSLLTFDQEKINDGISMIKKYNSGIKKPGVHKSFKSLDFASNEQMKYQKNLDNLIKKFSDASSRLQKIKTKTNTSQKQIQGIIEETITDINTDDIKLKEIQNQNLKPVPKAAKRPPLVQKFSRMNQYNPNTYVSALNIVNHNKKKPKRLLSQNRSYEHENFNTRSSLVNLESQESNKSLEIETFNKSNSPDATKKKNVMNQSLTTLNLIKSVRIIEDSDEKKRFDEMVHRHRSISNSHQFHHFTTKDMYKNAFDNISLLDEMKKGEFDKIYQGQLGEDNTEIHPTGIIDEISPNNLTTASTLKAMHRTMSDEKVNQLDQNQGPSKLKRTSKTASDKDQNNVDTEQEYENINLREQDIKKIQESWVKRDIDSQNNQLRESNHYQNDGPDVNEDFIHVQMKFDECDRPKSVLENRESKGSIMFDSRNEVSYSAIENKFNNSNEKEIQQNPLEELNENLSNIKPKAEGIFNDLVDQLEDYYNSNIDLNEHDKDSEKINDIIENENENEVNEIENLKIDNDSSEEGEKQTLDKNIANENDDNFEELKQGNREIDDDLLQSDSQFNIMNEVVKNDTNKFDDLVNENAYVKEVNGFAQDLINSNYNNDFENDNDKLYVNEAIEQAQDFINSNLNNDFENDNDKLYVNEAIEKAQDFINDNFNTDFENDNDKIKTHNKPNEIDNNDDGDEYEFEF